MAGRYTPHVRVRMISPCRSDRNGRPILLAVLHSTEGHNREGLSDLQGLGAYFGAPATRASSHTANDAEGNSARYVPDAEKAWTCAGFNGVSLNIEQIGFSAQGRWPRAQIRETARWLARWSLLHGVPLRIGKVDGATVVRTGVVRHSDLGEFGGNHGDPGTAFPLWSTILLARFYKSRIRRGK